MTPPITAQESAIFAVLKDKLGSNLPEVVYFELARAASNAVNERLSGLKRYDVAGTDDYYAPFVIEENNVDGDYILTADLVMATS